MVRGWDPTPAIKGRQVLQAGAYEGPAAVAEDPRAPAARPPAPRSPPPPALHPPPSPHTHIHSSSEWHSSHTPVDILTILTSPPRSRSGPALACCACGGSAVPPAPPAAGPWRPPLPGPWGRGAPGGAAPAGGAAARARPPRGGRPPAALDQPAGWTIWLLM